MDISEDAPTAVGAGNVVRQGQRARTPPEGNARSVRLPAVLYAMVMTPFGSAMAMMITPIPVARLVRVTVIVPAAIVTMISVAVVAHILRHGWRGGYAEARHAQRDYDCFYDFHAVSSSARKAGLWRGERISGHLVPHAAQHLIFARRVPGAGAIGLTGSAVLTAILRGAAARRFGRVGGDRVQFGLLLSIGLSDRTVAIASGKRQQGGEGCGGADHCTVPMTHDGQRINAPDADRPTGTAQNHRTIDRGD
jgi:hypothetical protein